MLPDILFPSITEYREGLEKYLEEHANHFIESIGRNSWISMFEDKLLPEVSETSVRIRWILKNSNFTLILV
jgi:hypothetical protein